MARTMKEKALYIEEQKQRMFAQFLLKGYSPAQITELLANYPKLIAGLDCQPLPEWFRDALVCWYNPSKQKLTNDQIVAGEPFLLKDFSGNGLDMTMHNFAGSGMSGMDGYSTNLKGWQLPVVIYSVVEQKQNIIRAEVIRKVGYAYIMSIRTKQYQNGAFQLKVTFKGVDTISFDMAVENSAQDRVVLKSYTGVKSGDILMVDKISEELIQSKTSVVFVGGVNYDSIIYEQLPLYEGGLVFDGTDDYGVCENMPELTDYTVMAKRKWLEGANVDSYFSGKQTSSYNDGAFQIENCEFETALGFPNTISFGSPTPIGKEKPFPLIMYQTKNKYLNTNIVSGVNVDSVNNLTIGASKPISAKAKIVNWEYLLFNRTLTPDEIDWVKYNIMGEELPKRSAEWNVEGRSNDEPSAVRGIILDRSGNNRHISLMGFGWNGGDGFENNSLVFDGQKDYGVCNNMPRFTMEKGYTAIEVNENGIAWQTSTMTEGVPSVLPEVKLDTNTLTIGRSDDGTFRKVTMKELHIFDHDMTPSAIEAYIRRKIDYNYKLK